MPTSSLPNGMISNKWVCQYTRKTVKARSTYHWGASGGIGVVACQVAMPMGKVVQMGRTMGFLVQLAETAHTEIVKEMGQEPQDSSHLDGAYRLLVGVRDLGPPYGRLFRTLYPDDENHVVPPQRRVRPEGLRQLDDILVAYHLYSTCRSS